MSRQQGADLAPKRQSAEEASPLVRSRDSLVLDRHTPTHREPRGAAETDPVVVEEAGNPEEVFAMYVVTRPRFSRSAALATTRFRRGGLLLARDD